MDDPIDFNGMKNRSRPPADLWPAIEAELDLRGRRRSLQRFSAVAAVLAVVVVLAGVFVDAPIAPGPVPVAETAEPRVTLAELRATSAQLEARLGEQRNSVVDGVELESLLWLEAELAWLDEQLAEAPADEDLWSQRIELLQELNQRYASGDWRQQILLASV